jgi:hypothetical protein
MGRSGGTPCLRRVRQKPLEATTWTAFLGFQLCPTEAALLHRVGPRAESEVPMNLTASHAAPQSSHARNCTCLVEIINRNG